MMKGERPDNLPVSRPDGDNCRFDHRMLGLDRKKYQSSDTHAKTTEEAAKNRNNMKDNNSDPENQELQHTAAWI
jgi:hypothetical protein